VLGFEDQILVYRHFLSMHIWCGNLEISAVVWDKLYAHTHLMMSRNDFLLVSTASYTANIFWTSSTAWISIFSFDCAYAWISLLSYSDLWRERKFTWKMILWQVNYYLIRITMLLHCWCVWVEQLINTIADFPCSMLECHSTFCW
jgi:hypothetical protein